MTMRIFLWVVACALGWSFCVKALAAQDPIDRTFAQDGSLALPQQFWGWGLAAAPDRHIYLIDTDYSEAGDELMLISRMRPDGSPDPLYQAGAPAVLEGLLYAGSVIVEPDGALLFMAITKEQVRNVLVRVLPSGTLDPGFGQGGLFPVPRPDGWDCFQHGVEKLLALPDGSRIAVWAGSSLMAGGVVNTCAGFTRITRDGRLDTTFGAAGSYMMKGASPEEAIARADGSIDVVMRRPGREMSILRLTRAGLPDASFPDGLRPLFTQGEAVAMRADGSVVVIERRVDADSTRFERYGPDKWMVHSSLGPLAAAQEFPNPIGQGASRIVALPDGGFLAWSQMAHFYRLDADGNLDPRFGDGGHWSLTQWPATADLADVTHWAVLPDGNVMILVSVYSGVWTETLMRIRTSGS